MSDSCQITLTIVAYCRQTAGREPRNRRAGDMPRLRLIAAGQSLQAGGRRFDPGTLHCSTKPSAIDIRREDAERCIEDVRGDEPEIAAKLRIEQRELEAGRLN